MRWNLGVAVAIAALASPVAADPPPAVNLLTSAPSTVAVSSTVANAAILPAHLVDGDLATAWNSRTDELVGAWLAFRVPAGAHVTAIRMTAGFTRTDQTGDLFTQNPRIRKVRVSRGGKLLVEQPLDPESRALQTIAVHADGGDFKIEILDVLPGSKATWREVCVSELEVWGTLPAGQAAARSTPVVRVGSLDLPPTPTPDECEKLLFPAAHDGRIAAEDDADAISGWDTLAVGPDVAMCRIDHHAPGSADTTVELALVRRAPAWRVVAQLPATTITTGPSPGGEYMAVVTGTVALAAYPLTATETAVLIEVSTNMGGPMFASGHTASTLYRAGATALTPVLDFESSFSDGESTDRERCTLQPALPRRGLPDLDVACVTTEGRWHHEDPRGDGEFQTTATQRFRWTGGRYAPRK